MQGDSMLRAVTCQFPVSCDIRTNAKYIKRFIKKAAAINADIVHFSETALSGYAEFDFQSFEDFNWGMLRQQTFEIMDLAKELGIWVILGSTHFISTKLKPTNCLYIISDQGEIVNRYDKCMLAGTESTSDQRYYSFGDHFVTLTMKGIKCGFLICYDGCFPEMYNHYRHQGVELMFHSFYNAREAHANILDEYVPASIRTRAADNTMWIAANNSSARHSSWPTCFARPDGSIANSLVRHKTGMLYHDFPDDHLDGWIHNKKMMKLAPDEVFTNGITPDHDRIKNRVCLP